MSNISASQVKELREKTGLGLMDCKKALEESQGDMELAIEELRKTSGIKASKKSGRSAADGLIAIKSQDDQYFMIEVNCETDFVARDDSFVEFTSQTLDSYVSNPESSLEEILANGAEDNREKIVQKLGENIVIRRIAKTEESSVTGSYLHSNQKIGCIVSLEGDDTYKSIAAASILAKTHRDNYILELSKTNENLEKYGIPKNKGYGTKQHMDALKQLGPIQGHRRSFKPCY